MASGTSWKTLATATIAGTAAKGGWIEGCMLTIGWTARCHGTMSTRVSARGQCGLSIAMDKGCSVVSSVSWAPKAIRQRAASVARSSSSYSCRQESRAGGLKLTYKRRWRP